MDRFIRRVDALFEDLTLALQDARLIGLVLSVDGSQRLRLQRPVRGLGRNRIGPNGKVRSSMQLLYPQASAL